MHSHINTKKKLRDVAQLLDDAIQNVGKHELFPTDMLGFYFAKKYQSSFQISQ